MFTISTKGRYATRAMLELALRNHDTPVQLKDIAKAQRISEKYLGRLMTTMVCTGLVHSRRGKNGGFTLAKPPAEISILDILLPLEGSVAPTPCLDAIQSCRESGNCVTWEVWVKAKDALTSVLDGITLEDLVRRHRKKRNSESGLEYFI